MRGGFHHHHRHLPLLLSLYTPPSFLIPRFLASRCLSFFFGSRSANMNSTDSSSHSESVQDIHQQQRGMASSNGGSRHGAHEDCNNNEYHDQEAGDSVDEEEALPSGSVSYHTLSPRRGSKSSSLMSLAFPLSRVKRLIKSEGEIQWVGMEAAFLIAKAAELFLEKFVEDSFDQMTDNNRMYLSYGDLSSHVMSTERLEFLADFVPEKVAASIALSTKVETDN